MIKLVKREDYPNEELYQIAYQEMLDAIKLHQLLHASIDDMKHYELFKEGDKVVITDTQIDDLGKEGVITLVRPSYCKIMIDGKERNHNYSQFKKID